MFKKYLVLGSCRVVNTIALEVGFENLLNKKDLWFTHYIQEHIQKVKHLHGHIQIPSDYKELFVRYEQQNHYGSDSQLRVGDSVSSGIFEFRDFSPSETLNVVVEISTIRYIKVPIEGRILWGHTTNLDLIRNSFFKQEGGYSTDEELTELMNEFEKVVVDLVLSKSLAASVNFIYVPHSPFIELKEGGWGLSDQRVQISDMIQSHCEKSSLETRLPITRRMLDIKNMIEENGGIETILQDQNHYTHKGRKLAFKYLDALAK